MNEVLCTTKFEYLNNLLFFQNEIEGMIGYISISNGCVHFLENVPRPLLDINTRRCIMCANKNKVFIVCNNGKSIYKIDNNENANLILLISKQEKVESYEWAGKFCYKDNIYVFGRDNGLIIRINCITEQVFYENTGIKDRLMWVDRLKNYMYGISWNGKYIYSYNLDKREWKCSEVNICENILNKSSSSVPLHGMKINDEDIYMHNKNIVFKYNINSKDIEILYKNESGNNGSRTIILDNSIIIPSFDQKNFYIINKKNGEIQETRKIENNVKILTGWKGSGEPCYTKEFIYLPIINSNKLLCIKKNSLDFVWVTLNFNNNNIKKTMHYIMDKNITLQESTIFSIKHYIDNI